MIRGAVKPCSACGQTKALADFYLVAGKPRARCKDCFKADVAQRQSTSEVRVRRRMLAADQRAADPAKYLAKSRRYRAENRERVGERDKAYKKSRAGHARSVQRQWLESNREKQLAAVRQWWKDNPQRAAEYKRRRESQKRGTQVGVIDYEALWTGSCALCGEPLDAQLEYPNPMSKSVDHILALANGGTHTQANLSWTHLICNIRKGARVTNPP